MGSKGGEGRGVPLQGEYLSLEVEARVAVLLLLELAVVDLEGRPSLLVAVPAAAVSGAGSRYWSLLGGLATANIVLALFGFFFPLIHLYCPLKLHRIAG